MPPASAPQGAKGPSPATQGRWRRALLAAFLGLLALRPAAAGTPPSEGSAPEAGGPPAPRAPDHPLGLNQGIGAIPLQQVPHYDFSQWERRMRRDARLAAQVGTRWYRVHSLEYPWFSQHDLEREGWDFTHRDALIRALQEHGIEILIVLGPARGNASCRNPQVWRPERYWPADEAGRERYRAYVRRVVERYDGDGEDDMPGLRYPIRWWQVDNEVDLHWAECRDRGITYATPEEYYQVVRATREAAREADPRSRLLPSWMLVIRRERGGFERLDFVRQALSLNGGDLARHVDALDLHDYGEDAASLKQKLALLDRATRRRLPVWLTETSVPGDPRAKEGWDARRQAGELVRRVVTALATSRIERIFWHSLKDAPPNPRSRQWRAFGSNSLFACLDPRRTPHRFRICGGRALKPVGAAFARLNALLSGYVRAEDLGDGRTFRLVRRDGGDLIVAWRDEEGAEIDVRRWLGRKPVRVLRISGDAEAIRASDARMDPRRIPVGADPVIVRKDG